MIKNPILPGFNPDPCICRKGDDYYLVVSSFEWFPGIPVYHSKDLKNWELYTHILTDETKIDLKKLPSSKGIWAPCLTYCEEEDLFYIVYGIMNSMNARYFDVDNYLITSKDIKGEWSEPVYLHSSGFDASIFHDDDGKKWIASLDWETREGYEKPGVICLVEYCTKKKEIVGYPKRIWSGGTDRGCIEAPHITKRGDYYYIMCAEGGTGYGHSVTMGRAKNIWGPYEKDSMNPIVTSIPGDFYERHDPDHLKPKYYNPESKLQKSGHGSYIETTSGEVYLVHLTSRPFVPELRCTLGRETAIQKMKWTKDNWLRMEDESNLAKEYVSESKLEEHLVSSIPSFDDFDSNELGLQYYAPRISPLSFADVKSRPGYVRIRGQESRTSLNKVSILARKLTSVYARITTKMEFYPEVHQHSAGLIMYYDNMNYINLRKYYSETLGQSALSIIHLENGEKTEFLNTRIPIKDIPIYIRLYVQGRKSYFEWSYDEKNYQRIGKVFDTTKFSDEYCKYGEFTGTFIGLTCADRVKHKHYADFDFFEYIVDESKDVD
ncbi:TPA: glycoside hydrolase family 43 protein [Clostridioides difficile]|uniref:glycoside hydrolase family 43 protein n=1 Tax=Clostridioides difficile TaxID=1496 RepID=UPI00093B9C53|nr:glycoside hydrolase family 43 protein [Clostridioides difficile]MCJ0038141.1 glycoside hydrolase family 43 protein [Clostridioides difficile]MCJ0180017.1 glycoside hydrolase family 43 protein [Clostridioides difficile]MCJ0228985.1 glycoside hydrolase family 43 protein [Clostridioides difficile]MCU6027605.1 glycoside hydrolase family 43 protein [Clostridioides difficile]MDB3419110.1 glycoside hydrolase family 43 protein [Clostridioides difficile]